MLDNHTHNLMSQLVEENKSLWRIKKHYLTDSEGCSDCKAFWEKMKKDKEDHIRELADLIKKHLG